MKRINLASFVAVGLALGGALVQAEMTVPYEDLFPTSVPEGGISMTVEFDPEQNDGTAHTSGNFTMDQEENDEPFGTLFLMSPSQAAMSDLSENSDWVLTGCDPKSLERQSVTAFCSRPMGSSSCSHVFKGAAAHTIVKMPSACGKGPLARVHSLAIHPNQTALSSRELKAKPASEPLYQLTFDYDFAAIPADNGPVYMRADASDIPGYWDAIVDSPTDPDERRMRKRTVAKFQRRGWWSKFKNWVAAVTTVKQSKSQQRNFSWKDTFTIFNGTRSNKCPGPPDFFVGLTANLTGRADFATSYGFLFEGTLVPPSVTTSYVYFNGNASAQANFTLSGVATVQYDGSRVTFGSFGFPGLSVPGIITVGPSLQLQGYFTGGLTLNGTLTTGIQYLFPPVNFAVGPGSGMRSPVVSPITTSNSITTMFGAGIAATGNAQLHLVPSVQLGISLVGGALIDAQAYVEADLFGGIGLNSTVSTTQPLTFCVNPTYGVNLGAGIRGKLVFWSGQTGPFTFYNDQFSVASRCFQPTVKREEYKALSIAHAAYEAVAKEHGLDERSLVDFEGHDDHIGLDRRFSLPGTLDCPKKA